jgi:hypothetical protein
LEFLPAFAAAVSATIAAAVSTTTTTATATAAAAIAAATTAATSITAAATGALLHRARFVDCNGASAEFGFMQFGDRLLGARVVCHFDEAESLATTGIAIGNYFRACNLAVAGKDLLELVVIRLIRKTTYKDFCHLE